jgi:4-hydroxy-tetrahydrodipicolinate synthase
MKKLHGSITALITPFKNGALDEKALRKLIRRQIKAGTDGLVPCGSTGEAATLSPEEYRRVVEITVQEAKGKIPVIPGTGTNSTAKTVAQIKEVSHWGVDALLVLVPYYNKPTQEGIFLHFQAAARATKLPIVVYNIPGRTGINLAPATLARLAKACPNIRHTKEAAGSLDQVSEIISLCGPDFTVLSGDDSLTLPMMAVGAKGGISVLSNILPAQNAKMCAAANRGDFKTARKIHQALFPVAKSLFIESNPIPVKAAAEMLGLCSGAPRLPLTPITPPSRAHLRKTLQKAEILK